MPFRQQIHQHSGSYQTIPKTAAQGLICLKALCQEEDAEIPSATVLNTLLASDFRDVENGSERSKGRSDVISLIVSRRSRYQKYQTDVMQAWCLVGPNKMHTVLFEGIRFIMFRDDTEWIRIPVSGRIEVRTMVHGGTSAGEIVFRKLTLDLTTFWKRRNELALDTPALPSDGFQNVRASHAPPHLPPPLVYEMPTNPSPPSGPVASSGNEQGKLDKPKPVSMPAKSSTSLFARLMGTATREEKRVAIYYEQKNGETGARSRGRVPSTGVGWTIQQIYESLGVHISSEHSSRGSEVRFMGSPPVPPPQYP